MDQIVGNILGNIIIVLSEKHKEDKLKMKILPKLLFTYGQQYSLLLKESIFKIQDKIEQDLHDIATGMKTLPGESRIVAGFHNDEEEKK